MKLSIFYAWQSDLPNNTNRYFIEDIIKKSINQINKEDNVISYLDRDTKDLFGSPDIKESIFTKINHCKIFICDISLIDNKNPNSNVLIELGYAVKVLGWNKIICLFNSNSGKIEDLPFDINHNRVTAYSPNLKGEKQRLSKIIISNIHNLFKKGKLYNPIEDHIKKKVDYMVLKITRNLINIFDFEQNVNLSKRIIELDNLTIEEMAYKLSHTDTLGFYYLYDYDNLKQELEQIFNQLLSSEYFADGWRISVIELINWISMWNNIFRPHLEDKLFKNIKGSKYKIKDMHLENPDNPKNSVVLLKHHEADEYVVIQGGTLCKYNYDLSKKIVCLQDSYGYIFAQSIKKFFEVLDMWLEESGNEIILDPDYYLITRRE